MPPNAWLARVTRACRTSSPASRHRLLRADRRIGRRQFRRPLLKRKKAPDVTVRGLSYSLELSSANVPAVEAQAVTIETLVVLVHDQLVREGRALLTDQRGPMQEEVPQAIPTLTVGGDDGLFVGHPIVAPGAQGDHVVRAHVFDVGDLESALFRRADHAGQRQARVRTREDVAGHEQRPDQIFRAQGDGAQRVLRVVQIADAGPLQDEQAVVLQELVHLLVVADDVLDADVLAHLEADDLVELALDVAVVANLDLGSVAHAVGVDAIGAEVHLLLRQGHAVALGPEFLGRAGHERAPAAADVEQGFALFQAQLLATAIDLFVLRLLERNARVFEPGRRVNHGLAQEPGEKVIAAVVVLADDAAVLPLGVDGHLGQEVRERPLEMRVRQAERHRFVARIEQRFPMLSRDVDLAFHVGLVHARDRDFLTSPLPRQAGVLELYEVVDNFSHEGLRGVQGRRMGGFRAGRGTPQHFAAARLPWCPLRRQVPTPTGRFYRQ